MKQKKNNKKQKQNTISIYSSGKLQYLLLISAIVILIKKKVTLSRPCTTILIGNKKQRQLRRTSRISISLNRSKELWDTVSCPWDVRAPNLSGGRIALWYSPGLNTVSYVRRMVQKPTATVIYLQHCTQGSSACETFVRHLCGWHPCSHLSRWLMNGRFDSE